MDDQVDAVHVDATGRDVGRDHHTCRAGGEGRETPLTGVLPEVAVKFDCGDMRRGQLAGEPVRRTPGTGEYQRPVLAARKGGDNADPVCWRDGEHAVDHGGWRGGHRVDSMPCRPAQETPHKDIDL